MVRRFIHYLKGPNPLHPDVVDRPVPPVRFRTYTEADKAVCLELYRSNESGRFPDDGLKYFENTLDRQAGCLLVGELDGKVVLCCGLNYWQNWQNAVLFYGLIDPEYQRRGIGVAMVLVRLALLRSDQMDVNVFIFAVKDSVSYYERFGFRRRDHWKDEHGVEHPWAVLNLCPVDILQIRNWLAKRGIRYPAGNVTIPVVAAPS